MWLFVLVGVGLAIVFAGLWAYDHLTAEETVQEAYVIDKGMRSVPQHYDAEYGDVGPSAYNEQYFLKVRLADGTTTDFRLYEQAWRTIPIGTRFSAQCRKRKLSGTEVIRIP